MWREKRTFKNRRTDVDRNAFFFLIETIFFFGAYGYERPKKTIFIQTIYISCIYPSFKSEFMTSGIHYMVIINGG